MMHAAVSWGAIHWAWPVSVIGLAFAALIAWSYYRSEATLGVRLLAAVLKVFAVGLLLLCLLEPLISGVRPRPGANLLAILVDNSRSMRIEGRQLPGSSRLPAWFGPEDSGWRARLEQDFDVRTYAFDRDVKQVTHPEKLEFDGDMSNLSAALATLGERFRERPLAGVLLLTDGNATDLPASLAELPGPDCPIFPVLAPSAPAPRDMRVGNVRVSQTHFETSPTTVAADVVAHGFAGQSLIAQLVNEAGEVVEEQTLQAGQDGQAVPLKFRFRPQEGGVNFHRLRVTPQADLTAFLSGKATREATTENNSRTLLVKRGGGPYRILYVGGRPNWEFKFLRRAFEKDDEVHLVALLRIANKEPKFQFQDQSGVSDTNRLFRGFEDQEADDTEAYDQPVFVRIGVDTPQELAEGFPVTPEALFAYDAVIIDDLESSFFSPDQMLLLRRFVSQRGGGLLMLGGQASFDHGGYARTPIGEMLPVYLNRNATRTPDGPARLRLTREGLLETWTRLRATEADEAKRLSEMPDFLTLNAVGDVKPGAMSVAEVVEGDTTRPAIVTQRFGKGRTAAVTLGDIWRWSMERDSHENADPGLFWRQLVRWLVAEVPQRVEIDVKDHVPGQPVELQVLARTPSFETDDNATVQLIVQPTGGEKAELTAEPSETAAGAYVAQYWPTQAGGYRVEANVTTGDGQRARPVNSGWVFAPEEREFERLEVNEVLLAQLASTSGGRAIHPDEISNFVEQLQHEPVPVTEHWVAPLWHQAWVLSLAIACLCGEWGLRRWKGLA